MIEGILRGLSFALGGMFWIGLFGFTLVYPWFYLKNHKNQYIQAIIYWLNKKESVPPAYIFLWVIPVMFGWLAAFAGGQ